MSKKVLAVLLALIIVVFSFVSCKKEKDPDSFYVDDEGNTQLVVKDDEGNYVVTDDEGNTSVVDDQNKIDQIEQNKEDEEVQSILNEINTDPDKFMEDADKNVGLEMSDDLVEEPLVTVAPDKGESDAEVRLQSFKKILSTNKFTIVATIKEVGAETVEYPFTYIRSGNGAYIQTAVPFEEGKVIKANMIIKDGVTYCEIPSLKAYMVVDDMSIEDLASGTFDGGEFETYTFVESGTVTLNGKKYTCDVYTLKDETVKYYFDSNDSLVRIEKISNRDSVITEISSITNSADESKIKKPSGFDISKLVE
jgi:hypothetical protein